MVLLGAQSMVLPLADRATVPLAPPVPSAVHAFQVLPPSSVIRTGIFPLSLVYAATFGFSHAQSTSWGTPSFIKCASSGRTFTSIWEKPVRSPIMEYSWGVLPSAWGGETILNTAFSSRP